MKKLITQLFLLGTLLSLMLFSACSNVEQSKPNIVFVLCDDLGFGDVQCLNPEHGKMLTPHIDRLACEGMTFKDAHSGSFVCSLTRYFYLYFVGCH